MADYHSYITLIRTSLVSPHKKCFYEDVEWPTERVTHHLLKSNRVVILVSLWNLLKHSVEHLPLCTSYSTIYSAKSLHPTRFLETQCFKCF